MQPGIAPVSERPLSPSIDSEVVAVAKRRRFTNADKRCIVLATAACTKPGEIGAMMRREGAYSSALATWRSQYAAGELIGTGSKKRGPKADPAREVLKKLALMTRERDKLYQLERKSSMNAPAEALFQFWETLRKKSWVRIEYPDSPNELRDVAGQVITALWQRSQELAHEGLAVTRSEAQAVVLAAQAAADAANAQAEAVRHSLEEVKERLRTAEGLSRAAKQELAWERGERAALQGQVDDGAPGYRGGTVAALHFWQTRKV